MGESEREGGRGRDKSRKSSSTHNLLGTVRFADPLHQQIVQSADGLQEHIHHFPVQVSRISRGRNDQGEGTGRRLQPEGR